MLLQELCAGPVCDNEGPGSILYNLRFTKGVRGGYKQVMQCYAAGKWGSDNATSLLDLPCCHTMCTHTECPR